MRSSRTKSVSRLNRLSNIPARRGSLLDKFETSSSNPARGPSARRSDLSLYHGVIYEQGRRPERRLSETRALHVGCSRAEPVRRAGGAGARRAPDRRVDRRRSARDRGADHGATALAGASRVSRSVRGREVSPADRDGPYRCASRRYVRPLRSACGTLSLAATSSGSPQLAFIASECAACRPPSHSHTWKRHCAQRASCAAHPGEGKAAFPDRTCTAAHPTHLLGTAVDSVGASTATPSVYTIFPPSQPDMTSRPMAINDSQGVTLPLSGMLRRIHMLTT